MALDHIMVKLQPGTAMVRYEITKKMKEKIPDVRCWTKASVAPIPAPIDQKNTEV
jgi:hypothetical protein